MLPTRPAIRAEDRVVDHDISHKIAHADSNASRWCAATWIDILIEKHAWLSAGLIWKPNASDSGSKSNHTDPKSKVP